MRKISEEISRLIEITTIIRLKDRNDKLLKGEDIEFSRFQKNQGEQTNLKELEPYWQKKFNMFGKKWDTERQNFRFFNDTFRLFYYSFLQLRQNKVKSINYKTRTLFYNELAGANLCGVYFYGKNSIDVMKKLCLTNTLKKGDERFTEKFLETRNKIFEHNFNPRGFSFKVQPILWSIGSTHSWLDILIHTDKEAEYIAKIDYYEDYYRLEDIISKVIKTF